MVWGRWWDAGPAVGGTGWGEGRHAKVPIRCPDDSEPAWRIGPGQLPNPRIRQEGTVVARIMAGYRQLPAGLRRSGERPVVIGLRV